MVVSEFTYEVIILFCSSFSFMATDWFGCMHGFDISNRFCRGCYVSHSKTDVGFVTIIQIAFMRLPNLLQKVAPFAVLFGAILSFVKLTKSRELVVARASGVSVWQFLSPSLISAIFIGIFAITVFNPVAAAMNNQSTLLVDKYLEGKLSQITVSESGLWLKQINEFDKSETLITAAGLSADNRNFRDIIILEFTPNNIFKGRIDAEEGKLLKGRWKFKERYCYISPIRPQRNMISILSQQI